MADDDLPITGLRLPVPDPTERTVEQLLRELASLKELLLAHINGLADKIELQFRERDAYVASSFQSSKEAAAKAEASTAKLLEQVQLVMSTTKDAQNDKIGTLERALTLIDGRLQGAEKGENQHRDNSALYIAAGMLVIAIVVMVASLVKPPPPAPASPVLTLPPLTSKG